MNTRNDLFHISIQHHKLYRDALSRSSCAPHIYWVANHAYQRMCSSHSSQAILISGESGAGKTETTKYLVEHLSYICGRQTDKLNDRLLLVGIQL